MTEAITANRSCCTFQNVRETLLSKRAAAVGIVVGAILITLGVLLHAYTGMGVMHCMTGAGAALIAGFILLQVIRWRLVEPRTIHEAIWLEDLESVKKFPKDVNLKNEKGKTPLYFAVKGVPNKNDQGCDPIVKFLLENGATSDETEGILQQAIWNKHNLATIQLLIEHGADVNSNAEGRSPLECAIHADNAPLVKLLIESGADMSKPPTNRPPYLHQALMHGRSDEVCLELIRSSRDPNRFEELGCDLNEVYLNWIPLERALARKNLVIFDALLENKANPDIRAHGEWLVHRVIKAKRLEAFKLLVKYGANLSVEDSSGKTALTLAQEYGFGEIVQGQGLNPTP
jgi:ankyrin repeat protein